MDILFLDANILFSAAYQTYAGLLQLWSLTDVTLMTSAYAVEEARRNLKQPKQRERLEKLLGVVKSSCVEQRHEAIPPDIVLPTKDRPILSAAIASQATHLITGDFKDFGRYYGQTIASVLVLPPARYWADYQARTKIP